MIGTSGTGGQASLSVSVNQLHMSITQCFGGRHVPGPCPQLLNLLDGFGTGEGMTFDAPFGHAGHRLHEWMVATRFGRREVLGESGGTEGVDHRWPTSTDPGIGAEIMGAGKFGPPGWQDDPKWRGWWGDNPPFHTPTYVLTHNPRPSLEMDGGTTFPLPRRRASGCTRSGAGRKPPVRTSALAGARP